MTKRNDFLSDLEDYLVDFDGETPLPERVRDALDAELELTHQVRPVTGRWKGPNMSSTTPKIARWGLVAAGLVVAVGLGAAIMLPGRTADVGAAVASPSAPPTPAPSPSAAPSPRAALTLTTLAGAPQERCEAKPTSGCIVPGTYVLGAAVPGGMIDVPAGWWSWDYGPGSAGILVERGDAPNGSGWGLTMIQVGDVRRDPCDPALGTFAQADVDTPAKLAGVIATMPGFTATPATSAAIAGIEGVQTRLSATDTTAPCDQPVLWETPAGMAVDGYPAGEGDADDAADIRIFERNGQLFVFKSMASARTSPFEREQGIADDPTRHAADLVAQQAMIDSIRFDDPTP